MCVYPSISNEKLRALVTFTHWAQLSKKNQFSVKTLKNVWQNNNGKIAKPWWPSGLRHHYLAELFSQVAVVVRSLSVKISGMCVYLSISNEKLRALVTFTHWAQLVKSLKNIWQNGNGKIAKLCWPSRLRHYYLAELFSQVDVVVQTLSVEISVMCVYPSISNEKLWALVTFTALGPTINKIRFSAKSLKNLWQNKN